MNLNVKHCKLLRKIIRENLLDLELGEEFLDLTPKCNHKKEN